MTVSSYEVIARVLAAGSLRIIVISVSVCLFLCVHISETTSKLHRLCRFTRFYFAPTGGAKYFDGCRLLSVYLSVRSHIWKTKTTRPNFAKCSVHVACAVVRSSSSGVAIHFYTCGFVQYVTFSNNEPCGTCNAIRCPLKVTHQVLYRDVYSNWLISGQYQTGGQSLMSTITLFDKCSH